MSMLTSNTSAFIAKEKYSKTKKKKKVKKSKSKGNYLRA